MALPLLLMAPLFPKQNPRSTKQHRDQDHIASACPEAHLPRITSSRRRLSIFLRFSLLFSFTYPFSHPTLYCLVSMSSPIDPGALSSSPIQRMDGFSPPGEVPPTGSLRAPAFPSSGRPGFDSSPLPYLSDDDRTVTGLGAGSSPIAYGSMLFGLD